MYSINCFSIVQLTITTIIVTANSQQPDLLVIITDDQDNDPFALAEMRHTTDWFVNKGTQFEHSFVSTPLCCPSRASMHTGLYAYAHGCINNTVAGGCGSIEWQHKHRNTTLAAQLHNAGYVTFFAGKYLNQYGLKHHGAIPHTDVSEGWDWWNALLGNSRRSQGNSRLELPKFEFRYFDYALSINGSRHRHGHSTEHDYLTNVIKQQAVEFLRLVTQWHPNRAVLLVLCPPAPHAPFTPENKYRMNYTQMRAPRTASFNIHDPRKHWLVRHTPHPMSHKSVNYLDGAYRNRLRTLLSTDMLVDQVLRAMEQRQRVKHHPTTISNWYAIYTSDNGFHHGQFCLPTDKRQPYEFDVRVPLMFTGSLLKQYKNREISITLANTSGHDVKAQHKTSYPAVINIDLMPTLLDLAGVTPTNYLDGQSLVPWFDKNSQLNNQSINRWNRQFLIEYWGESGHGVPPECETSAAQMAECHPDCVCADAANNTYTCLREMSATGSNTIYCEFNDNESFVEYYNMRKDPDQMHNRRLSYRRTQYVRRVIRKIKRRTNGR